MPYLYLAIAIVAEVVATSSLRATDGFTRWIPSSIVALGYGVAFYFLSLTLRTMAVGIAYAGLLVAMAGVEWLRQPTLAPALGFGVITLAVPLFVMQPAMGAGLAGSKTATPLRNVLRSFANHAVFGVGLYLAAAALAWTER